MRILVLMPIDERMDYAAAGIYKALPHEIQDVTFCMPMFRDYLVKVNRAPGTLQAAFDTLLSAEKICQASVDNNLDLLLIGNVDKRFTFDKVFNFQDIEKDLPYKDLFLEKARELVKDEPIAFQYVKNLHTADESAMPLHNCTAAADFLAAYMKTDPHLDVLKKEYEHRLEELLNASHYQIK